MGKNSKLSSQNDIFKRKSQQATEDLQAAVVDTEDAMRYILNAWAKNARILISTSLYLLRMNGTGFPLLLRVNGLS